MTNQKVIEFLERRKKRAHPCDAEYYDLAISALQEREERSKYSEDLEALLDDEWVETKKVQKALGITFAQGLLMFEFARSSEWWSVVGETEEERARNGQKITTYFRLKGAEE